MLVFKKEKLVECTQAEFAKVEEIYKYASCFNDAVNRLYVEFVYFRIPYKAESKRISTTVLKNMAYNAVNAVMNKFKYLKIKG